CDTCDTPKHPSTTTPASHPPPSPHSPLLLIHTIIFLFLFLNDTATPETYTLSLHDALPISPAEVAPGARAGTARSPFNRLSPGRSEEHTSELQSLTNLVCRLVLAKKKRSRV